MVHLNVDLKIHQLAHGRVIEDVNALHQYDVRRFNQLGGVAAPVLGVIIHLGRNGPSLPQGEEIVAQRIVLESVRLVIVDAFALLKAHVGMILVVRILL